MNQDWLLDLLGSANRTIFDPLAPSSDRLQALKTKALAELESAHVLIYQQRVERAIKSEIASIEAEAKNREEKSKRMLNDNPREGLCEIINRNYFNTETYNKNDYFKDETERPRETAQDVAVRKLSFQLAQKNASQDPRVVKFGQRVAELEKAGQTQTLEAMLTAAHDVSLTAPHSAQDFLTTFEHIPEQDYADYATLVSHLFKDRTGRFSENRLLSRLQMLAPRRDVDPLTILNSSKEEREREVESKRDRNPLFLSKSNYDSYSSLNSNVTEDKKFKNNDEILDRYSRPSKRDDEFGLSWEASPFGLTPKQEMPFFNTARVEASLNGQLVGYSLDPIPILQNRSENSSLFSEVEGVYKALLFSEVEGVYKALGNGIGSNWVKTANALVEKDFSQGKAFAMKSRRNLVAYVKELDWDLSQFVEDYESFGEPIFKVASFTSKYASLPKERVQSMVRGFVDSNDGDTLKALVQNDLPEKLVETVTGLLPEDVSDENLVRAFSKTGESYSKCKSNNVAAEIVSRGLYKTQKTESIDGYLRNIESVDSFVAQYINFANEQRKHTNLNLSFNDIQAQNTLELYVGFLGKNFTQFRRDFEATGTELQRLPEIKRIYSKFFDDDKLRTILNYVTKKRSKDMLNNLARTNCPEDMLREVTTKLDGKTGKRDIVHILVELNKSYDFLRSIDTTDILSRKVSELSDNANSNAVMKAISEARKEFYATVIGEGVNVPKELEEMVDNVVFGYHKNTGRSQGVEIQPALRIIASTYLREGAERCFEALQKVKQNQNLRAELKKKGVDIDTYEKGIQRQYHLSTNRDELARIKERVDAEVKQVYDRLEQLEVEEDKVKEIQALSLREQFEAIEKILGAYEFNDENKGLKLEIKGHIQSARSMNGSIKEMEDDVDFYVSQDPLEALHMGQYFGSCLSLAKNHGGVNGWASVVQTMDSNKNVIYARTPNGKHIGRNRTAMTDKGVLCTRFYQNGNMFMDDAWVDYLTDFSDEVQQDVMIPTTFALSGMQSKLEGMMQDGKVVKEHRTVNIAPAYFSAFYGDGLLATMQDNGNVSVSAEVYVIKPELKTVPVEII